MQTLAADFLTGNGIVVRLAGAGFFSAGKGLFAKDKTCVFIAFTAARTVRIFFATSTTGVDRGVLLTDFFTALAMAGLAAITFGITEKGHIAVKGKALFDLGTLTGFCAALGGFARLRTAA